MASTTPPPAEPPHADQEPADGQAPGVTQGLVTHQRGPGGLVIRVASQESAPAEARRSIEELERYALGAADLARPRLTFGVGVLSLEYEVGPALAEPEALRVLTPAAVGERLERVAVALAHLHAQGIAHGHLSPEVLTLGDRAVAGLGVAALLERGSPGRAAAALPESLRAPELGSRGPTPESDVFALGVLVQQLTRALGEPNVGPCRTTEALERWAERATATRPADRPPVGSLAGVARSLAADGPTVAAPVGSSTEGSAMAEVDAPYLTEPVGSPPPTATPRSAPPARRAVRWARPLASRGEGSPPPSVGSPRGRSWGVIVALALAGGLMVGTVLLVFFLGWRRGGSAASVPAPPPGGRGLASVAPSTPGGASPPAPPEAPSPSALAPPFGSSAAAPALAHSGDLIAPPVAALPASHARAVMPIDPESPSLGDPRSLVTVVLFGDPASPRSLAVLAALRRAASSIGDVRLVWRHATHDLAGARAARAATAIRRARGADAFFLFLAAVARGGGAPRDDALLLAAGAANTDAIELRRWLASPEPMDEIERDRALAVLFGVREPPVLFVNGLRVAGELRVARLEALVREERRKAATRVADGVPPADLYPDRAAHNLVRVGAAVRLGRCPTLARAPWRGAARPLVTVAEFTDFECALCADLAPAIDRLVRPGGDVRHVHLDLPLTQHANAQRAAVFAREAHAAHGAEVFFRLGAALRRSAAPLDDAGLSAAAASLGLDGASLLAGARRGDRAPDVAATVEEARRLGVRGIPTLYVNARRLDGVRGPAELNAAVVQERARAARLVAAGIDAGRVWELLCGAE